MIQYQNLIKKDKIILESVIVEAYDDIPYEKIALIISTFSNEKITDSLIESYIEQSKKRNFSVDRIISEIRKLNKLDHNIVENKLEFKLNDGTAVTISEETYESLVNILKENQKAVDFMNENKVNFFKIFELIQKEQHG